MLFSSFLFLPFGASLSSHAIAWSHSMTWNPGVCQVEYFLYLERKTAKGTMFNP